MQIDDKGFIWLASEAHLRCPIEPAMRAWLALREAASSFEEIIFTDACEVSWILNLHQR